jgi:hypothetical protein
MGFKQRARSARTISYNLSEHYGKGVDPSFN